MKFLVCSKEEIMETRLQISPNLVVLIRPFSVQTQPKEELVGTSINSSKKTKTTATMKSTVTSTEEEYGYSSSIDRKNSDFFSSSDLISSCSQMFSVLAGMMRMDLLNALLIIQKLKSTEWFLN